MKVILCENIEKVGNTGEVKVVSDGHARNFLFPRNLALPATPQNLRKWESEKRVREIRLTQDLESARRLAQTLGEMTLDLSAKSGREGHLFGSITSSMIREALLEKGFSIDKKNIILESPIKLLGEYQVSIRLHAKVTASLKVNVVPSDQPKELNASSPALA